MKIEKLSKGRNKKIILGITILLLAIGIIYITNSKAKYQVTKSVQIVNGKVNYSLADLNIIALHVQEKEDSEIYTPIDIVPQGNYEINIEKSYCTVPGNEEHITNMPMEYKDNGVYIKITEKGTKCYVFLDFKKSSAEKTLADLGITEDKISTEIPNFDKTSCSIGCGEATNGLFKESEKGQPTYYFRGTVNNNYFCFAGFYWRIIRINSDGSIRLIYNGTSSTSSGTNTMINNGENQKFNTKYDNNAYVGYIYGNIISSVVTGEENYEKTHANTNESEIKKIIDTWYETNIRSNIKSNYERYINMDAGFCGDRLPYEESGISVNSQSDKNKYGAGKTPTYYGSYVRTMNTPRKPSFDCQENNDLYTVNSVRTENGNKTLKNPVGLITADEVLFAGGTNGNNTGYWLYTGKSYWTISPWSFHDNGSTQYASMFMLDSVGKLAPQKVDYTAGVRPVINLKADIKISGEGTVNNPYIVQND